MHLKIDINTIINLFNFLDDVYLLHYIRYIRIYLFVKNFILYIIYVNTFLDIILEQFISFHISIPFSRRFYYEIEILSTKINRSEY